MNKKQQLAAKQADAIDYAYIRLKCIAQGPQLIIDRQLSDFRAGMELSQQWAKQSVEYLEKVFPKLKEEKKK